MLHDPKHDKTPSFAGFALFVASKNPEEKYHWHDCGTCAVSQYLKSLGIEPTRTITGGDGKSMLVGRQELWKDPLIDTLNSIASVPRTFGELGERLLEHQRLAARIEQFKEMVDAL